MREISEYKLLGNYLINLYERSSKSTIKYDGLKTISANIEAMLNQKFNNYVILPIEKKSEIVNKMIYKGVFKTYPGNKVTPFKQVYPYEVAKYIFAEYGCDGSLTFSLTKDLISNPDTTLSAIKNMYSTDSNLLLQSAINHEINVITSKQKNKVR